MGSLFGEAVKFSPSNMIRIISENWSECMDVLLYEKLGTFIMEATQYNACTSMTIICGRWLQWWFTGE